MDKQLENFIQKILQEDEYQNDITTKTLIDTKAVISGSFVARSTGIASGMELAKAVFEYVNPKIKFNILKKDGSYINRGDVIASVTGPMANILSVTSVITNLMERLCSVATTTNRFVAELKGLPCDAVVSRDYTPLLREYEIKAVTDGGGKNYHQNLKGDYYISSNHVAGIGSTYDAVTILREKVPDDVIEVEVDNRDDFYEALDSSCDRILLCGFKFADLKELMESYTGNKAIGVFGNVTLANIRSIALLKVKYIVLPILGSYKGLEVNFKILKRMKKAGK